MTAPPDIAALVKRLRNPHYDSLKTWDLMCAAADALDAADALEACARDAARYRALEWADGHYIDSEKLGNTDGHFEYKPAGYDGMNCNRYYLGSQRGSFVDVCDRLVAAIDRARGQG